jgi:hypothetical protein
LLPAFGGFFTDGRYDPPSPLMGSLFQAREVEMEGL